MEWRLFADLADIAGDRHVEVEVGPNASVKDALDALLDNRPSLNERVLDESGNLRDHVNVLRNGVDIRTEDGLDTPVDSTDELALFPPVSGGIQN